jgi:hypothetical protein
MRKLIFAITLMRITSQRQGARESRRSMRPHRRAREFLWQKDDALENSWVAHPGAQYGTQSVQAASATTRRFMGSRLPAVPGGIREAEERTGPSSAHLARTYDVSQATISADCQSTATDHRTVPTDRRWFARRRGPVGTHPDLREFRSSIRHVRRPAIDEKSGPLTGFHAVGGSLSTP